MQIFSLARGGLFRLGAVVELAGPCNGRREIWKQEIGEQQAVESDRRHKSQIRRRRPVKVMASRSSRSAHARRAHFHSLGPVRRRSVRPGQQSTGGRHVGRNS